MSNRFIDKSVTITIDNGCKYDSRTAYKSDFSINGSMDNWSLFENIYSYGCWNGCLFGSLLGTYGLIGYNGSITQFDASYYDKFTIVMKINPASNAYPPISGKIMWKTISNPTWSDDRSYIFPLFSDDSWHSYLIDLSIIQNWQGDITDLKIYPIFVGYSDDEFYIKNIQIDSTTNYVCRNSGCSFYNQYSHPCKGVGNPGSILSISNSNKYFDILKGVNDTLIININSYGFETITLKTGTNIDGALLAIDIEQKLSTIGVGGYYNCSVKFNTLNKFIIESSTNNYDSIITIAYSLGAVTLGFHDTNSPLYTSIVGMTSATGYISNNTLNIPISQLYNLLLDNNSEQVVLDPFSYNIEAGRSDWLEAGMGASTLSSSPTSTSTSALIRNYSYVDNIDKTIIDILHPFNNNGYIKKIYLGGTYYTGSNDSNGNKIYTTNGKIKILRPHQNKALEVILEIEIPTTTIGSFVQSTTQEYCEIDCNIYVQKGDLLGIYNFNLYSGQREGFIGVDATYYQEKGDISGTILPTTIYGDGTAGLLFYARSDQSQNRLSISLDLNNRYNIDNINIESKTDTEVMEYNIARCLDSYWTVDLFSGTFITGYYVLIDPVTPHWNYFTNVSKAYGIQCLSDGIKFLNGDIAALSYSSTENNTNSTADFSVVNPTYFFINGDCEWLGSLQQVHPDVSNYFVKDFTTDPVAITLWIPNNKIKSIYKSIIYFKERSNFRDMSLSTFISPNSIIGNADIQSFELIPTYTYVTIDGFKYTSSMAAINNVDKYLFSNPMIGQPVPETINDVVTITNYDQFIQSTYIDWNIIQHEFDPVKTGAFRIYTDYHLSTKINEIEVYTIVSGTNENLADSITVSFSDYGDFWTYSSFIQNNNSTTATIESAPQYINIVIEPIKVLKINSIALNISENMLYIGKKGCDTDIFLTENRRNATNLSKEVVIKNIYGGAYDLSVDIIDNSLVSKGLIFYSPLSTMENVLTPIIGAPIDLYKEGNYLLLNSTGNCAINCNCYGLTNLAINKPMYLSYTDGYSWTELPTFSSGTSLNVSNIVSGAITIISLPKKYSSKWWKVGFTNKFTTLNVREMLVINEVGTTYSTYFDSDKSFSSGGVTGSAPHLVNESIVGSYYELAFDNYISFEFDKEEVVDKIILFHDYINDYNNSYPLIDTYTSFCLTAKNNTIMDYSYNEFPLTIVGGNLSIAFGKFGLNEGIEFDGDTYITIDSSTYFGGTSDNYTFELDCNFSSLPSIGEQILIMGSWQEDILVPILSSNNNSIYTHNNDNGWAIVLNNVNGNFFIDFVSNMPINNSWDYKLLGRSNSSSPIIDIDLNTWYHLQLNYTSGYYNAYINTQRVGGYVSGASMSQGNKSKLIIGKNLIGVIENVRISKGIGGYRNNTIFTDLYERMYTFDVYNSSDNLSFQKYSSVDTRFNNSLSYYDDSSRFDSSNHTYLCIDLQKNYSIDIVRAYGINNTTTITSDILSFSSSNTSDLSMVDFTNGTIANTRWIKIDMVNGDGISRTIDKLGIYPDISITTSSSGLNLVWDNLSKAITSFSYDKNIAGSSTVTASSYFGQMYPAKVIDGNSSLDGIDYTNIYDCWGSDSNSTQWLKFSFSKIESVYKIILYFGYDNQDSSYMITSYNISYSLDDINYTLLFSVVNNSNFIEIHTLPSGISAQYIRLDILKYNSKSTYLSTNEGNDFFQGALVKQVQIIEYNGFNIINSDDYPVICVDLNDYFYVDSFSVDGIDPAITSTNWNSQPSDIYISTSNYSNPEIVSFIPSTSISGTYIKWALIKDYCATNYNNGPHYLKHFNIKSPLPLNPCDYYWWWESTYSTIASNSSVENDFSMKSLNITTTLSGIIDNVSFIEGDNFGKDSYLTYNDGIELCFFIDDFSLLDFNNSYFYFGGIDSVDNPVVFNWYLSSLSLSLGKNTLYLLFKDADFTTSTISSSNISPLTVSLMEMRTIGITYIANKIGVFIINGFRLYRNIFLNESKFDKGLYLCNDDYLRFPITSFNPTQCTIEFWLTPTYNMNGVDSLYATANRMLFYINNTDNDIIGAFFTSNGLIVYFGNVYLDLKALTMSNMGLDITNTLTHFAFVFSSNGSNIDTNGSTFKLFVNGNFLYGDNTNWTITNNNSFYFMMGGKGPQAIVATTSIPNISSVDGTISNLKIYNYCKTSFDLTKSIEDDSIESIEGSNKLIEISKDNVTFYKVGSPNLPLVYSGIMNDEKVSVFIKSSLPKVLSEQEKRTVNMLLNWTLPV